MVTLLCKDLVVRHEADLPPTLSKVSFALEDGERVALMGLNGSGKTTLLASLVGLLPHDGEIRVCGERLERGNVSAVRGQVGFLFNVPEDQLLFPKVIEDVAFGLLRRGVEPTEAFVRARRILAELGVEHLAEMAPYHLSHGQKQRVALAGVLVTRPALLLLDEPTAGLDPPGKLDLARLLAGLDSAQLIATHDLDFAEDLCSRFLLLEQGQIARQEKDANFIRAHWQLDPGGR